MKKLIANDGTCASYIWDHGDKVELSLQPCLGELTIAEIHIKPDGGSNGLPSLCFILQHANGVKVFAYMDVDKLAPAMSAAINSVSRLQGVAEFVSKALRKAEGR